MTTIIIILIEHNDSIVLFRNLYIKHIDYRTLIRPLHSILQIKTILVLCIYFHSNDWQGILN